MAYLIGVSLIWALSFGLIKQELAGLNSGFLAAARLALTLPCFAYWMRLGTLPRSLRLRLSLVGGIQFGLMYTCYFQAFRHLAAHQIALLTVFTPLWVMLWDDFREAAFRPKLLAAAALASLGCGLLLFKEPTAMPWAGVLWVQASNLCFAAGQIEYRRLRPSWQSWPDLHGHGWLLLGGLLTTSILCTLNQGWGTWESITPRQAFVLLYLGTVATGLGFLGWNLGATRVGAGTLAALNNLKIPLAAAAAILLFGESAPWAKLGAALTLTLLASLWCQQVEGRGPANQTATGDKPRQ